MFINKTKSGKNNLCGENVAVLRKKMGLSQRELAERLQLQGLDVEKNAVQRIEAGKRFVTDIELVVLSAVLKTEMKELVSGSKADDHASQK